MTLAYLYDPLHQFQDLRGVNNVSGWLEVFLAGTDDHAMCYSDFVGTMLPDRIGIDNDGRAVVVVDSEQAYRVEVHGADGNLLYTQEPVWTQMAGGGGIAGSLVNVESQDGSIVVDKTTVGMTTTFDLSVAEDATENLEWSKVSGTGSITEDGPLALQYQAGSMTVVNGKLRLEDDQFYHITTHFDVVPSAQGNTYDTLTFTLYKVNDDNETGLLRTFVKDVDSSLTDPIVVEYSTDIVTDEAVLVYWTVEGIADGISVGLADMYAHRVYSGIPRLPENEYASQEWVTENFQSLSGMSAYQTTSGMSAYATKGELATKLDASASSQFAQSSSLSSYQPTSSMSAYQTVEGMSGYLPISATSELFTGASTDTSLTGLGTSGSPLGVSTDLLSSYQPTSAMSDYQPTSSMSAYQTTADMTAYMPVSATSELFTGITHDTSLTGSGTSASPLGANSMRLEFDSATMYTAMSGDTAIAGVNTSILSSYQPTSAMGNYATTGDLAAKADSSSLAAYQPTSSMSAYQETSGMTAYLPVSASSSLFTGVTTDTSMTGSGLSSSPLGVKTREVIWDSATMTTSESGTSAVIGVNSSLFDGFATTADLSTKMDDSASAQFAQSSSLADYQTTADMSAYATTGDLSAKLDASASSQFAQSSSLADYQQTADMSAYATTDSLSAYATTDSLSAKLDASASSQFAQSSSLSSYQPTSSMSNYATTAALADKLDASAQVVTSVTKYGTYVTGINGSQLNAYSASTASNAFTATYATYDANGRALTSIGQGNYTSESGTIYISGDDIESTDTAYIAGETGADTTTSTSYNPNQILNLFGSVDGGANVELQAWSVPVTAYLGTANNVFDVSAVISSWDQMPYRMSIVATGGRPIYFSATNGFTVLNATSFTGTAPRTAELAHKTALSAYQPTSAMSAYATTASLATKLDSTASSQFAQSSSLSSYQPTSAMSAYATTTDLTAKLDASAQVVTAVNTNTASLVTGINGIAIAAGSTYSAGSYVEITDDTINVTGLQPSGSYATTDDLSAKLDASAQVVTAVAKSGTYVTAINGSTIKAQSAIYANMDANGRYITSLAASSSLSAYQPTSSMSAYALASSVANADWEQTATSSPAYIENKPDLVDIVAGPGIHIDNPDGNTLRVSMAADYEVELYSGTKTSNGLASFTLSEYASSFDRIRFYGIGYGNTKVMYECPAPDTSTEALSVCYTYYCRDTDNNPWQMRMGVYTSTNGLNFTIREAKFLYGGASALAFGGGNTTQNPPIYRIVGVKRIAGGN